tara:strand:+ start:774411 stop:775496 length:1086 start_codon:yes stop_codon:yes gene_type:complete
MAHRFESIDLSKIKLDANNPRLPKSKQGKDEKSIIQYMLLEAATLELMMAIGENDFFAGEQLLVIEEGNDEYITIEGNRRLTAVKLLSNPDISDVKKESLKKICSEAKFKPTSIPCLVFDDKDEILKYLGFRHITGIKSWKLLEKARYLNDLRESEFKDKSFLDASRRIAKMIGSSSNYIKRLLTSLYVYNKVEDEGFYNIDNLNDTRFHLNYFTDGLFKENIRAFLSVDFNSENPVASLNDENLKKITHWWFEKTQGKSRVIGDSKGLSKLDKVLGSKKAIEAFENGATINEAYELTDDLDVLFRKEVKSSLKKLETADSLSNRVNEFYSELPEDLRTIYNIAKKIKSFKDQRETGEDEF